MRLLNQLLLTCTLLAAFAARGATNVVTTVADTGAGSLRQTIADSSSGDTITFTNTLSGATILLSSGEMSLNKNLTIDAAALPNGITINGNATGRAFVISGGTTNVLTALTITGCSLVGYGGAIYNSGTLTVNRCTLTGNTVSGNAPAAGLGGGIFSFGETLTVNQCTLLGNSAQDSGGGIFNYVGVLNVNQCTVYGNSASSNIFAGGGGVMNYAGTGTLSNSIVAVNTAIANTNVGGLFTSANNLTTGNPLLAPLGNYGGPTPTMPPQPGSAAIDAGGATSFTTDQRGLPRSLDGDGNGSAVADIGAAEFQVGSLVTTIADTGEGSLRAAIISSTNGSTITFTNTLSGSTILLTSGQLLLNKNLTIDGSTLSGGIQINGNVTSRVFYVTNGVVAVLKSLTIANGLAPVGTFAANGGGGAIFCRGRVDLLNCTVVSNAVASGTSFAGGIACDHGDVRLTNCTVAFNKVLGGSGQAGAFYNFGGTLIFNQCTVASNQAASFSGGVANQGSTTLRATVLANGNTDFFNNSGGASMGNNLIADGSNSGVANGVNGDQVGTSGSPLNALLAPLGNYGGPTPTMPPLPGSPAIDAGGSTSLTTDQRGLPRVAGPFPDIGAVELPTSPIILNTADSGYGSLRYAVTYMSNNATITFPPALVGATITLASEIVINHNVTIDASALPGGITISGGNATRIFNVPGDQTVSLTGITLTGGNGGVFGGAISLSGNLSLTRCTLFGNHSSIAGGAINNFGGTLSLLHCTLTGNSADGYAGAILNEGGIVTLRHCTLALNSTTSPVFGGGAIDNFSNGTLTMTSCILAGNAAVTGAGPELLMEDGTLNATNCLIGDGNDSSLVNGVNGNIVGTSGTPINALLAPLGNYGGPTQTMPPLPGSPAIDAASVIAGLATDQRGSARNVGAAPDIGAVESGGLWVQNTNNASTNSLRDVISNTASITNSKTILFVPALSGQTITLASQIVLSNNVAIEADSLPQGITLSGGNSTAIFFVTNSTVALLGLTLTGGNGSGGNFVDGGAIENYASLYLARCTFFGNVATIGGGGAILNYASSAILVSEQCTFSGNSGSYAGAIVNSGSTTLVNCTLASNHSTGTTAGFDGGGAIDNFNGGTLSLTSCILAGNTAATGTGPELWMENGSLTATNCLIGNGTDSTLVNGVNGNLVGTGGSPINALLAPLGNYGGSTQTMPPLPGSPAINAAGASSFATDQRGYPRPVGLAADIGAVEGIYNGAGLGTISSVAKLGNGSVRLSFTNLTNASFPVVATTNISQSLSDWSVIGFATETSAGNGLIQFTDSQAPNFPQRFYRVKSP